MNKKRTLRYRQPCITSKKIKIFLASSRNRILDSYNSLLNEGVLMAQFCGGSGSCCTCTTCDCGGGCGGGSGIPI